MTKKTFGGDDFGLGSMAAKSETNSVRANGAENTTVTAKAASVNSVAPLKTAPNNSIENAPEKQARGGTYKRNTFKSEGDKRLTAFVLNKQTAQQFKVLCAAQFVSASSIINSFIEQYIKEHGK